MHDLDISVAREQFDRATTELNRLRAAIIDGGGATEELSAHYVTASEVWGKAYLALHTLLRQQEGEQS